MAGAGASGVATGAAGAAAAAAAAGAAAAGAGLSNLVSAGAAAFVVLAAFVLALGYLIKIELDLQECID